jgi:hypothetical protein
MSATLTKPVASSVAVADLQSQITAVSGDVATLEGYVTGLPPDVVLGRTTTSGTVEEIPFTAQARALNALTDYNSMRKLLVASPGFDAWRQYYERYSDFEKSIYQAGEWLTPGNTGTGAGVNYDGTEQSHPGILSLTTGTDTTGWASVSTDKCYVFGAESYETEFIFKTPASLPDGTETYTITMGFNENNGQATGLDAATLQIHWDGAAAAWRLQTRKDGTESTTTATGAPTLAGGTWYRGNVIVNAAANLVTYYINGTSVGTLATNIPQAGDSVRACINIVKSAGTTARILLLDAMGAKSDLAATR